jgi:hypothetical protein
MATTSKSGLFVGLLLAGLVAVSGVGSMGLVVASVYAQSPTTTSVVINEVELNPKGNDSKGEWVELYNPTSSAVSIGNFKVKTSFKPVTISIPAGTTIGAGNFYVLAISGEKLYNSAESISLIDGSGRVADKTPSLVDRNDDSQTWQRVPDGGSEWKFKEQTKGAFNSPAIKPASSSQASDGGSSSNNGGGQQQASASSSAKCSGRCVEGIGVTIADPDTLYIQVGKERYKVDLSLTKAPARSDKNYDKAVSYTRNLCFGSSVLVDQDDSKKVNGKNLVGEVYCSSHNLNQELLDSKLVQLDKKQCSTSEFSSKDWARRNGC